jgi:hypothetical protein
MKSFNTIKIINLDWHLVQQDLIKYSKDTQYTASIVDGDTQFSKKWTDNLKQIEQEYRNYGYTKHNTKIWKSTNKEDVLKFEWQHQLVSQLPLDNPIVTLTRQDPGQILPWHYDRHFMLKNKYPNDARTVIRILVFLEDWKMGHILQIHDDILVKWKQGQAVVWDPSTYHVAANIGIETKWTCNITGFVNDNDLKQLLHDK